MSFDVFHSYDSELRSLRKKVLGDLNALKTNRKRGQKQIALKIYEIVSNFNSQIDRTFNDGVGEIGVLAGKSSAEVVIFLQNTDAMAKADPETLCMMNDFRELHRNKYVSMRQVTNLAQSILIERGMDMRRMWS